MWIKRIVTIKWPKKKKTEFLARIAEQLPRANIYDESSNKIVEEGIDKLKGGSIIEKKDEIDDDLEFEEENASVNIMLNDNENEEHKYNQNNDTKIKSRDGKKLHKKKYSHNHSKKNIKKRLIGINIQYLNHMINDSKVISNKYTICI